MRLHGIQFDYSENNRPSARGVVQYALPRRKGGWGPNLPLVWPHLSIPPNIGLDLSHFIFAEKINCFPWAYAVFPLLLFSPPSRSLLPSSLSGCPILLEFCRFLVGLTLSLQCSLFVIYPRIMSWDLLGETTTIINKVCDNIDFNWSSFHWGGFECVQNL